MIDIHKARVLGGTTKHSTTFETTVVLKSRLSRVQFSFVRYDISATCVKVTVQFETEGNGQNVIVSDMDRSEVLKASHAFFFTGTIL